jgi:hypothetical protein
VTGQVTLQLVAVIDGHVCFRCVVRSIFIVVIYVSIPVQPSMNKCFEPKPKHRRRPNLPVVSDFREPKRTTKHTQRTAS